MTDQEIKELVAETILSYMPTATIWTGSVSPVAGQPCVSVLPIRITLDTHIGWDRAERVEKVVPLRVQGALLDVGDGIYKSVVDEAAGEVVHVPEV